MSTSAHTAGAILTVDLDGIVENWRTLQARVAPADCAAVVKADAYGLGVAAVAPALQAAGCRDFFVATIDEGLALREILTPGAATDPECAPPADIYVLNGLIPGCEDALIARAVQPVLNDLLEVDAWTAAARRHGRALPAALQLDTGMSRLGLTPDDQQIVTNDPQRLAGIRLTAIISHLACADELAHPLNVSQLNCFRDILTRMPPARASLANSAGIFLGLGYHGRLVRPGIALYGGAPLPYQANPMRPVVRLDARVLQVRAIDAGTTVGYGATHQSAARERIATLSAGYADGILRSLSNRGTGYVGEKLVRLVGRVSMDLMTFDVSAVPESEVQPGTFVELIGPHVPIDTVAAEAGTIAYEILTSLGRRYHRVYTRGGC